MLARLVGGLLQRRREKGYVAFAARSRLVRGPQSALLNNLVARNGHTALARRLGLHRVSTLDDLRERVPITDYDMIQPELQAALEGQPDQLVRGRPPFFGMTSGTTGRAKYIPIDDAYRAEFQSTVQHFLYAIVRDHPTALSHKALYLVGPAEIERTAGGAIAGSISGYNLRRLSPLLRHFYAVPAEVFEIAHAERQAYAVARFCLMHELSIAFSVTTAPLALIGAAIERHFERLLRDIHNGTLDPAGIPDALHGALSRRLRPNPRRARQLASRVGSGRPIPRRLFPTLALISCWHHASAGSHLHALRELWGEVPLRPAIYSATEGWMNIPMADADDARPRSGVLASDAVVLELLDAEGRTHFPHELTQPGRYEVVLTSGAGLWRYRIGDEVEVTGFFEAPASTTGIPAGRAPLFHYVQKAGSVLSLAHDMTTESHVRAAVERVLSQHKRWVFGPSPSASDRYRVVLEEGGGQEPEALAPELDRALRDANMGYEMDRSDDHLRSLEVVLRSPEAFDDWESGRLTTVLAQAKPTVFVKSAEELPP